ncbi:YitT family protein [Spiroplasma endosymbiont of Aspidapion aeneum]|uniref:YitT family protein n=1 Tax=Spiroplasma endosymbiont of Aspidapion aeneum TaxID=3066276 RepID=UPI00313AFA58
MKLNNEKDGIVDDIVSTKEVLESEKDVFTKEEIDESLKKVNSNLLNIDIENIESYLLSKREQMILIKQYFKKRFWKELLLVVWASLLTTITFDYLISSTGKTGNFSFGFGTICRFLAIVTYKNDISKQGSFYFIYYFILNIPLIIFGAFKIGLKFTLSSFIYITLSMAFDQLLQVIPFLNTKEFTFIVNYQQIISDSPLSGQIFLFLFSALSGLLLGYAYSILYKIGSSSGGSDFVIFYFSMKYKKPLGNIARTINMIILFSVVIANSLIIPLAEIPIAQRYNVLSQYTFNDANAYKLGNGQTLYESVKAYLISRDPTATINPNNWLANLRQAVNLGYGNQINGPIASKLRIFFIFGPSLFSSLLGVVVQSLSINWLYPRYKVRTHIITTREEEKIVNFLSDKGYKNDLVSWNVMRVNPTTKIERSNILLSMLMLNWKLIEKDLFMIDPEIRIVTLKTSSIKGFFNLETESEFEHAKKVAKNNVMKDSNELLRIRNLALQVAKKEEERLIKKNSKQKSEQNYNKNNKDS